MKRKQKEIAGERKSKRIKKKIPSSRRRPLKKKRPLKLKVDEFDLAHLRSSGLSDETIRENQIYTATNDDLVFPYRDLDGELNGFVRTRPRRPYRDSKGKEVKYLQPKGSPVRAFFPHRSLRELRENEGRIFITEGEKKALALSQIGATAIGLGGVYSWKKKGTDELIDDLAQIEWGGRVVYIVFDWDAKEGTRRDVALAQQRLVTALTVAGARVFSVDLLPGPENRKQGVDDFLVTHNPSDFWSLVDDALSASGIAAEPLTRSSGRTDTANAVRLVAKYRHGIRYVAAWGKWLIWDGKRWCPNSIRLEALAKSIANDLWKEIAGSDQEQLGKMATFATKSNSANGIRNMIKLARSEPGIEIRTEALDTHPTLLNVENGTIDLTTGQLREHRREDLITQLSPVSFDPEADCPDWESFLHRIFEGNNELIGYVQRLIGYSVTGLTTEHVLPFLFGTGANGKSTFIETVFRLLGPNYSMKATPDLLMVKRNESHPTERADLFRKRFVACVETEDGKRLAESLVKEMTGGDKIRTRRMREDFWEFSPTHHVWIAGNYKPQVNGTDHGIWRRIKLIPFDVVIPKAEQDGQLGDKLSSELSGILNWAIEGCLAWQKNGMQEPEIVQLSTEQYAEEMDEVGQFINEHCETDQTFITAATPLYQAYIAATESVVSQRRFGQSLASRGFTKARMPSGPHAGRHGWKGLRLITESNRNKTAKRKAKRDAKKGRRAK
ncbi:MAG: phage/plasmid primase, P4 family [Planctomycetaceae bacterium]|nr:phage/plasmid primase, P4 family [Planctomycetaceae bacterium]